MSIRICGDNTVASPAITSASDTDTGLQFGTNEVKVVNGDLDITDGNLIVASGHGIDFSATANSSGTMTSELLDDYEEGSFTPNYSSGITSPTYNGTVGYYTKIGNVVYFTFRIQANGGTNNSSHVRINGFPFTPNGATGKQGGAYFIYPGGLFNNNDGTDPRMLFEGGVLRWHEYDGSAWNGDFYNGILNRSFHIQGHYFV